MKVLSNIQHLTSNISFVPRQMRKRRLLAVGLALLMFLVPLTYLTLRMPEETEAAWFDDSWAYRKEITFGNSGSADSDKKVLFQIDTATLITAGKIQSSCQDVRFTDANGLLLRYYINVSGGAGVGCDDSSSDFYVLMPTIVAGDNLLYVYYGNPTALAGTESANFSEATFAPTSGPTIGSEEKGPTPSLYLNFDEGYGTTTYDASANQNNASLGGLSIDIIEQQINIIDQEYSTTGSAQPTDNSLGLVDWDIDAYTGETAYFEAIVRCDSCTGGNTEVDAILYTDGGGCRIRGNSFDH